MIDRDHPALTTANLSSTERMILVAIEVESQQGGWCWLSKRAIGVMAGVNRSNTSRAITRLVKAGLLATTPDPRDKRITGYQCAGGPPLAEKSVAESHSSPPNSVPIRHTSPKECADTAHFSEKSVSIRHTSPEQSVPIQHTSPPPTSTLSNISNNKHSNNGLPGVDPSQHHQPNQKYPIADNWFPKESTIEVLTQLHGVSEEFVIKTVPEFVIYWHERGDARPGWDATFIVRIKRQWAEEQQRETKQGFTDASGKPISEYDKVWNDTFEEAFGDGSNGYGIDTTILLPDPHRGNG